MTRVLLLGAAQGSGLGPFYFSHRLDTWNVRTGEIQARHSEGVSHG